MRVLIVGGTGVFGSRLARLLLRDGHVVTVAGRDLAKAEALAAEIGANALRLPREGDLSGLAGFDAVVDAAGPFHTYGGDPYRLARAAIATGVHYLDLCDDARFCAGIAALDGAARAAGVAVVSGLSSVPAISSAAVVALAAGAPIEMIDTAILPGNRAPRGLSVMRSILSQSGRPMPVWRGAAWEEVPGWSDPAHYLLAGGVRRQGFRIEVPDTLLFPKHFSANSVTFRAGLELATMRYGLAAFSALRRLWPFQVGLPLVRAFKLGADMLEPFGTGRGGMVVTIVTGAERRIWRLIAEEGDGPFIPATAARALLRRSSLEPGAGSALGIISLVEAEAAMSDLRIRFERVTEPAIPLFPQVLGADFVQLPPEIRATHQTQDRSRWQGLARITRGAGLWPRLVARIFGFPPAGEDVPVTVVKTVTPKGEVWERSFAGRRFRSHLSAKGGAMEERFGPFTFRLGLRVEEGALHFPVLSGRLGPLPLPRFFLPGSVTRESVSDGIFRFDVALYAPLTGQFIIRYEGALTPAPPEDPSPPPLR